jgi:glutamate 5-kinase
MQAPPLPVVIKLGSGILTQGDRPELDYGRMQRIVSTLSQIRTAGQPLIIVTSGAVAAGVSRLGLESRPTDIPSLQACAAIGQCRLMHRYEMLAQEHGIKVAQLLLTHADLKTEASSHRVRQTLDQLLAYPAVLPFINENDSVAVDELRFGDNDVLSSKVAQLVQARLLVLLTSVPGVLDQSGQLVERASSTSQLAHLILNEKGIHSVGGMASKLDSIQRAIDAGIEAVIASGLQPEQLPDIIAGQGICTRFSTSSLTQSAPLATT